ncbi:MAG: hypothetical protein ACM3VT_05475 [Solirubrobacterales bacterium]
MATAAQVQANRLNAQKSTGPRTAEGKERACRNAIKHGLLAQDAVIQGEDPAQFEMYREGMLQTLAPVGAMEAMLAERVVGLSWRLRRAERLQNAAFAELDGGETTEVLEELLEEWKRVKGSDWDRSVRGVVDREAELGRAIVEDFSGARVMDRLLMYERRIESSLYRTMAQLRREREARTAAESKEVSPSQDNLPVVQESAPPTKLASFGAAPGAEEVPGEKCQTSDGSSDFELSKLTPCGVTTNEEGCATEAGAETLHDRSCETNPMAGEVSSDRSDFRL